jgi:hypothetical protein
VAPDFDCELRVPVTYRDGESVDSESTLLEHVEDLFSMSKGFRSGQAGLMEHAALTREMISHAALHKKDLYMVQIDFSNAFGSVPHDLILGNWNLSAFRR